jgi:hypothetical protein
VANRLHHQRQCQRLGKRGLTSATKRSNDSAAPSALASAGGSHARSGVRGRDLILSRSGQRHMIRFAHLISIRNVCRPGATNGPYRVAGEGREFLKSPQTALSAVREKAVEISSRDGTSSIRSSSPSTYSRWYAPPIAALWVGGILQRRSDAYKAKLSIFATLVGLRRTPLSTELVRTLGTRLSQSGTDGSNPVSSSGESGANRGPGAVALSPAPPR